VYDAGFSGALDCCCEHVGLSPDQRILRATSRLIVDRKEVIAMEVLYDRVAGLDVGKASVTVCVRTPGARNRRQSATRTFTTMSRSLAVMADWLVAESVTLAAMESTSTYWKPIFYRLEDRMETSTPRT
jgi:hypothetical protein